MTIIKVYIAHYNNGETWEDFYEWYGDNVYVDRRECEREILKAGYRKKNDYYIRGDRYRCYNAKIEELEFVDSTS